MTDLAESEKEIASLFDKYQEMQAKHDAMEKEKESLSKSDAVGLKDREAELAKEMKRQQAIIDSKNSALEGKQEQYREEEDKQKKEEDRKFEKEREICNLFEEMQTEADCMAFEEHSFFQKECEEHLEETIAFDTHEKQFSDVKNKIHKAFWILQETNLLEPRAEELLKQRDSIRKELDAIQREIAAKDMLFVQEQNAWKEALYAWNGSNTELLLNKEQLKTAVDMQRILGRTQTLPRCGNRWQTSGFPIKIRWSCWYMKRKMCMSRSDWRKNRQKRI